MEKKGYYLVLEGGEGCGKDTQAKLLKEYFDSRNIPCEITREPGGTKIAEQIANILKDKENNLSPQTELFLFEAARADNYEKIVLPFIKKGEGILIKTRGWQSSIAHQGFGGGMDINYIQKMNDISTSNVLPDLLLILDIPPEKGLKKEVIPDRFAAKGLEYHNRVREGYLWIAKEYPKISIIISYEEGIEKMHQKIKEIINKRLSL
jgi:dTMP kinase